MNIKTLRARWCEKTDEAIFFSFYVSSLNHRCLTFLIKKDIFRLYETAFLVDIHSSLFQSKTN